MYLRFCFALSLFDAQFSLRAEMICITNRKKEDELVHDALRQTVFFHAAGHTHFYLAWYRTYRVLKPR